MSRDLNQEICEIRQRVSAAMAENMASKQFGATIMLALIGLHLKAREFTRSRDLDERRRLLQDIDRSKMAINKGIELLEEQRLRHPDAIADNPLSTMSLSNMGGSAF